MPTPVGHTGQVLAQIGVVCADADENRCRGQAADGQSRRARRTRSALGVVIDRVRAEPEAGVLDTMQMAILSKPSSATRRPAVDRLIADAAEASTTEQASAHRAAANLYVTTSVGFRRCP